MKTILITGANRGIGLGLTKIFNEAGWQVIACCREPNKADDLSKLKNILIERLDVSDPRSIEELSKKLSNTTIDVLVNNAGIMGSTAEFGQLKMDDWLQVFKVNTVAPTLMTQAFVKQVAKSELKIIVNMSSTLGSIGLNQDSHYFYYRCSKAALNMATKNIAADLRAQNIIAVALHPGWVKTDMGGSNAEITIDTSVNGLFKIITKLTPSDSGTYLSYNGNKIPW